MFYVDEKHIQDTNLFQRYIVTSEAMFLDYLNNYFDFQHKWCEKAVVLFDTIFIVIAMKI